MFSVLPRYIPKKNENVCPRKNFYAVVHSHIFHDSQKVKQHKCLLTDEWINKIWQINTTVYYSATKNELVIHMTTWINYENILLNENARFKRHIL